MNYKGIIYYPKFYQEIAELIGKERWNKNKKTRIKNDTYSRPNKEQELRIDVIGVLAEIILLHKMVTKDLVFDHSILLSKNPVIKNDIVVYKDNNIIRFEVKAVTGNFARINEVSHNKKICDYYALIRPTKELDKQTVGGAYFWTEEYINITKDWSLRQGQYGSPYYEKQLIIDTMDIINQASKEIEKKNV